MSTNTTNLNLLKKNLVTDGNDTFNFDTILNDNWDKIDVVSGNKVDKVAGKQLSTEDFTSAEKTKLTGIASGANNYTHPANHPASMIIQDSSNRFTTDAEKLAMNTHMSDYTLQIPYIVTAGVVNVYTATLIPTLSAYVAGVALSVNINITNTGAATINVNGLGAKAIIDSKGNAMTTGKLRATGIYTLRYNGTAFQLQGEGGGGTALAADMLVGKTATVDSGDIVGTLPDLSVTKVVASNGVTWTRRGATTISDIVFKANAYNGKVAAATTTYEVGLVGAVPENFAAGVQFGDVNAGFIGTYTSDANAIAAGILAGQSGYVKGAKVSGTMPNNGTAVYSPATTNVPIANGYHAGSVVAAIGGSASAPQVLSGYVFSSAYGINQTGTMPVRTGYQAAGAIDGSYVGSGAGRIYFLAPNGYYSGSEYVYGYEPNWSAANIPAGMSMFGLVGSGGNAKSYASGIVTSSGPTDMPNWIGDDGSNNPLYRITVSGLNFPNGISFINVNVSPVSIGYASTFYSAKQLASYKGPARIALHYSGGGLVRIQYAGSVSVTNTGFVLPAAIPNQAYTWEAWGN